MRLGGDNAFDRAEPGWLNAPESEASAPMPLSAVRTVDDIPGAHLERHRVGYLAESREQPQRCMAPMLDTRASDRKTLTTIWRVVGVLECCAVLVERYGIVKK